MIKTAEIGDLRQYRRYAARKPLRALVEGVDDRMEIRDVSAGGAALKAPDGHVKMDNNQFVELHLDSVGELSGRVVRTYEGGAAVQFDIDDDRRDTLEATLRRMRKSGFIAEI